MIRTMLLLGACSLLVLFAASLVTGLIGLALKMLLMGAAVYWTLRVFSPNTLARIRSVAERGAQTAPPMEN